MVPVFRALLISTLILFSSCKKFRMESNVPECIKEKAKIQTKEVKSTYASILEYEFQNKILYVFDLQAGETDSKADIYDSDCRFYGYLGGPEKNKVINGEDFTNAVFKRRVWPAKN